MRRRRKDGLQTMRISRKQAKRWGLWAPPPGTPGGFDLDPIARRQVADLNEPDELNTNPGAERLVALFHEWETVEADAAATKREIAARLMEYRPISITELSRLLGVSRPTLYAWQTEAEQQQPEP